MKALSHQAIMYLNHGIGITCKKRNNMQEDPLLYARISLLVAYC